MKISLLPLAVVSLLVLASLRPAVGQVTGTTNATRTVQLVLSGPFVVEDADTFRLADQRMQLFGIDAPQIGERCDPGDDDRTDCGLEALAALLEIIGPAEIFQCILEDVNRADDLVVRCFSDDFDETDIDRPTNDLGEILVLRGFARRDRSETSLDAGIYTAAERLAQDGEKGLWDCTAGTPRSWVRDKDRNCEQNP